MVKSDFPTFLAGFWGCSKVLATIVNNFLVFRQHGIPVSASVQASSRGGRALAVALLRIRGSKTQQGE
jgi:hypothetical protein